MNVSISGHLILVTAPLIIPLEISVLKERMKYRSFQCR